MPVKVTSSSAPHPSSFGGSVALGGRPCRPKINDICPRGSLRSLVTGTALSHRLVSARVFRKQRPY